MRSRQLLLAGWIGLALAACQSPPPPAAEAPRRKSFEDSSAYVPPPAAGAEETATGGDTYQQRADRVRDEWDRARAAGTDAERMQHANEALRQTQQAADAPSGSGQ
jgi:hypothetical protein